MPATTTPSAPDDGPKTTAKTVAAGSPPPPNPPNPATAEGRPPTRPDTEAVGSFLKDDALALIQRMAAGAHNLDTIASALGLSRRALGRRFEADPVLKEAFDAGRASLEQELASLLLEKARGGNVTCAIFLLKAQCGWRDTGADVARGPTVAVQINLPAALSEAAYNKLIEEKPRGDAD